MFKKLAGLVVVAFLACGEDPRDGLLGARDLNTTLGPVGEQPLSTMPDPNDGKSFDVGDGGTAICTTKLWGDSEVRALSEMALLDANEAIYPGSLIAGNGLENGTFTPIGVPRAGGTISIEGLNFDPGAHYYRDVAEVSAPSINQATQDILSAGPTLGTSANIDTNIKQVYDFNSMMFSIGLDAKFPFVKLSGNLSIDTTETRNYYFMRYRQVFYTVNFKTPETPFAVFRDGEKFSDPAHQINKDNPALYVSSASYGRQYYFLVKSRFSIKDIEASLKAAFGRKASGGDSEDKNGVAIDSKISYVNILSNSEITYIALGGDAAAASGVIKAGNNGQDMFDAVRQMVSDPSTSVYSRSNPGRLISYNLRYLKDNRMSRMSFSTVYKKRNCDFTYPGAGKLVQLKFYDVDDYVKVFVNDDQVDPVYQTSGNPLPFTLNPELGPGNNWVKIALFDLCGPVKLTMKIAVDGIDQPITTDGQTVRVINTWLKDRCGDPYETPFNWQYVINKYAAMAKDVVTFKN